MEELFCAIYVDARFEVIIDCLVCLGLERVDGLRFAVDDNEIEVLKNIGFREKQKADFPDGFLYFKYRIEVFSDEHKTISLDAHVRLISRVLEALWSSGIPAVAACDYEEILPNSGGYKADNLPWPNKNNGQSI